MRLKPGTETVPSAVNRYLLPNEHQVIVVRSHPASMIAPGLALPGVLAAAARLARRSERPDVVWYASGLVAADCVRRLAAWPVSYFIVTSKRLLIVRGVLTRTVTSIPLDKVESLEFHRTIPGRCSVTGHWFPGAVAAGRCCPGSGCPIPSSSIWNCLA
jgi:hypothetical protein